MPRRTRTTPQTFRRLPPINGCQQKRRFPTEKEAITAADTQMLISPHLELRTYFCSQCGGWHLTRSSPN